MYSCCLHGLRVPFSCSRRVYIVARRSQGVSDCHQIPRELRGRGTPRIVFVHLPTFPGEGGDVRGRPVTVDGVQATSLQDTVLDCLQTLDFCKGLVIADSYLWVSKSDAASLAKLLDTRRSGCRNDCAARLTARYAESRAESGGESYARARMIELGYAIPGLQVAFRSTLGGPDMRADFLWNLSDGRTIVGELDGMSKYSNLEITRGKQTTELLVEQNMRDNRLGVYVDSVIHFTFAIVRDTVRFCELLDAYGIPRQPGQWQTRPKKRERRRRGLRGRRMQLAGGWDITCYIIDGPATQGPAHRSCHTY